MGGVGRVPGNGHACLPDLDSAKNCRLSSEFAVAKLQGPDSRSCQAHPANAEERCVQHRGGASYGQSREQPGKCRA
jgi:hypothetical protein